MFTPTKLKRNIWTSRVEFCDPFLSPRAAWISSTQSWKWFMRMSAKMDCASPKQTLDGFHLARGEKNAQSRQDGIQSNPMGDCLFRCPSCSVDLDGKVSSRVLQRRNWWFGFGFLFTLICSEKTTTGSDRARNVFHRFFYFFFLHLDIWNKTFHLRCAKLR